MGLRNFSIQTQDEINPKQRLFVLFALTKRMPLKTVLVDDESAARSTLRSLIQQFLPELELVGEADSVQTAVQIIKQEKPDLVFLDMELKGAHGFTVLEQIDPIAFEVIITTAHSQFALNSYQYGVADYILKPLMPSQLKRAVARVVERHTLQQKALEDDGTDTTISVSTVEGFRLVPTKNIIRLEAERNYTWLHIRGEEPLLMSKTLSHFEDQLSPFGFLRIHHSHLINPISIRGFQKTTGELVLEDRTLVPISREKKKLLGTFLGVL